MPVKKGKSCFGDVMREGYAGDLHSGKNGPVVKDPAQMKAIAASMCYDEGCAGGCGCEKCPRAQGRKAKFVELGFAEDAAHEFVFGQMAAPLGYPTPTFGPEVEQLMSKEPHEPEFMSSLAKKRVKRGLGIPSRGKNSRLGKRENSWHHAEAAFKELDLAMSSFAAVADYSFGEQMEMAKSRIDVMRSRLEEIMVRIMEMEEMGEVKMDAWMHDKLTLAADYLSAVADNAVHSDGLEVEFEPTININMPNSGIPNDTNPYGEKKGLWANIHAKRKRIKAGSGERMRKPGSKGAPSTKDLKDSQKKE